MQSCFFRVFSTREAQFEKLKSINMNNGPYDDVLFRLREELEEPLSLLNIETLSRHNRSYLSRRYADSRFDAFVVREWPYYRRVLDFYVSRVPRGSSVLEVGMFIPVVPLLLSWSGYRVTTVEKVSLYGDALLPMISIIKKNNITFLDVDIMDDAFSPDQFDAVNLLAVIEHLLGSPRCLLQHIHSMVKDDGFFVLTVPNQARLIRRLGLFFGGVSVHPPYDEYFCSDYPFSGHHREYTFSEVQYALSQSGFYIEELGSVRYPPNGSLIKRVVTFIGNLLPRTFHQVIFTIARKAE